jgi:hypothetical protein
MFAIALYYLLFHTVLCSRRKRDVASVDPGDNMLNAGEIPIPDPEPAPTEPIHSNLTWPTANNITEDDARDICSKPILESSVYHLCVNFTRDLFDTIVGSCVDDIQVRKTSTYVFHLILKRQVLNHMNARYCNALMFIRAAVYRLLLGNI